MVDCDATGAVVSVSNASAVPSSVNSSVRDILARQWYAMLTLVVASVMQWHAMHVSGSHTQLYVPFRLSHTQLWTC